MEVEFHRSLRDFQTPANLFVCKALRDHEHYLSLALAKGFSQPIAGLFACVRTDLGGFEQIRGQPALTGRNRTDATNKIMCRGLFEQQALCAALDCKENLIVGGRRREEYNACAVTFGSDHCLDVEA